MRTLFVDAFEQRVGYVFKDYWLIRYALTHPSFSASQFELLEFVGDRVISLIASDIIWKLAPPNEKIYAYNFVSITNKESLLKVGKAMDLSKFIQWKGCKSHENTIIADGCEAVFGAIYLDSDLSKAREVFNQFWKIQKIQSFEEIDPKTYLQNWANEKSAKVHYSIINQEGPPHQMHYTVELTVDNMPNTDKVISSGSSIKIAEKNAAKLFIEKYGKK